MRKANRADCIDLSEPAARHHCRRDYRQPGPGVPILAVLACKGPGRAVPRRRLGMELPRLPSHAVRTVDREDVGESLARDGRRDERAAVAVARVRSQQHVAGRGGHAQYTHSESGRRLGYDNARRQGAAAAAAPVSVVRLSRALSPGAGATALDDQRPDGARRTRPHLARARQLPSGDSQEKLLETLGPLVKDQSRNMEQPIRAIGEMWKSNFMQFITAGSAAGDRLGRRCSTKPTGTTIPAR